MHENYRWIDVGEDYLAGTMGSGSVGSCRFGVKQMTNSMESVVVSDEK